MRTIITTIFSSKAIHLTGIVCLVISLLLPSHSLFAQNLPCSISNPFIWNNDSEGDAMSLCFVMALAHNGQINLIGITSAPCNGYGQSASGEYPENYQDHVNAARNIGWGNIPDATSYLTPFGQHGFVRPASGNIDETQPRDTDPARFIRDKVLSVGTSSKPVVIGTGGPLTTVASAYLLASQAGRGNEFASKVVVYAGIGRGTAVNLLNDYNGTIDAWSVYICLQKLKVVFTNYDPNDANCEPDEAHFWNLVDSIHKWQPGCLINDRLNGIGADYGTPEQEIPGENQSKTFETCMTMNDQWGYNKNDKNWKSARDIIFNLCDIVSKGGNYLLNIGPTSEGVFPKESKIILKEVGQWVSNNGEAIYNAKTDGPSVRWNDDIKMITAKPGIWYLHVFDWPKDHQVFLDPISKDVKTAYLLADKKKTPLKFKLYNNNSSVMIILPEKAPDEFDSVIALEFND